MILIIILIFVLCVSGLLIYKFYFETSPPIEEVTTSSEVLAQSQLQLQAQVLATTQAKSKSDYKSIYCT
jgi:cytochrome b subunit of formate dehydrogenase